MGMYTGLVLDLETKPETPDSVIKILEFMIKDRTGVWLDPTPDHPLFTNTDGWWTWCLQGSNSYFNIERSSELHRPDWCLHDWYSDEEKGNAYNLSVCSDLKNYHDQFQLFLDWITPYVYGGRGWIQYECDESPTLVYWSDEDQVPKLRFVGKYERNFHV